MFLSLLAFPKEKGESPFVATMTSALQPQVAVGQTSFTTLQTVRSLINAASGDHVQAKSNISCEGLGVTLAICPSTVSKIQRTARAWVSAIDHFEDGTPLFDKVNSNVEIIVPLVSALSCERSNKHYHMACAKSEITSI